MRSWYLRRTIFTASANRLWLWYFFLSLRILAENHVLNDNKILFIIWINWINFILLIFCIANLLLLFRFAHFCMNYTWLLNVFISDLFNSFLGLFSSHLSNIFIPIYHINNAVFIDLIIFKHLLFWRICPPYTK